MNIISNLFLKLLRDNKNLSRMNAINPIHYNKLNNYYYTITKLYAYIIKHLNITLVKKEIITNPSQVLDKTMDLQFMSKEINSELGKSIKYLYVYNINLVFKGENYSANVQIYSKTILKLTNYYKQIFYRSLLLSLLNEITRPLNIIIYLSDSKKICRLPKNATLGRECINSGSTSFSYIEEAKINNYTIVFRKEELHKLILHELIHNLDYDFKNKLNINLYKFLNISPNVPIKIYEAYTELISLIIHCILLSYEKEYRNNIRYAKKLIYFNTHFNLFQCAKILHHFSYKNVDDFIRPYYTNASRESANTSSGLFSQTTSVLSYFIIKTALLVQFNKSMQFLDHNTHLFKINSSPSSNMDNIIKQFVKLILYALYSNSFTNSLGNYFNYISNSHISKPLMETFRMTLE